MLQGPLVRQTQFMTALTSTVTLRITLANGYSGQNGRR